MQNKMRMYQLMHLSTAQHVTKCMSCHKVNTLHLLCIVTITYNITILLLVTGDFILMRKFFLMKK